MEVKVSGGMFFNNQERINDLEGVLQGSVMFAQTCIIPSKPATDSKDIRPHLVALRDTLVLFDPISPHFDDSAGVQVSVLDISNEVIFDEAMLPPDKLPNIPERLDGKGTEFNILETMKFDHEMNSPCHTKVTGCDNTDLETILKNS